MWSGNNRLPHHHSTSYTQDRQHLPVCPDLKYGWQPLARSHDRKSIRCEYITRLLLSSTNPITITYYLDSRPGSIFHKHFIAPRRRNRKLMRHITFFSPILFQSSLMIPTFTLTFSGEIPIFT